MRVKTKNIASQSLKILLCLVMLFGFLCIQPKQKVDAALPIVAWAGSVLGSMLVDTALDMGVKFVDEQAKNAWKDKAVGKLWDRYGESLKNLKPTKKDMKKWVLDAPKWLMVAMVDLIADDADDVVEQYNNKVSSPRSYEKDSLKIEFIEGEDKKAYNYWLYYGSFAFKENDRRLDVIVGSQVVSFYLDSSGHYKVRFDSYASASNNRGVTVVLFRDGEFVQQKPKALDSAIDAYEKRLALEMDGKTVYENDGTVVTNNYYLDLPDRDDDGNEIVYSPEVLEKIDSQKYPVAKSKEFEFDFGDGSDVIDVDYEVINEGDEIDWEIIEKDITNNSNNYDKVIDFDYEPTVNNYYEVVNEDDFKNDINIIIKNEIDVGDGDGQNGTWSGEITIDGPFYCVDKSTRLPTACKTVEAIDGSLLDYVKNSYDYAVNAVKSGVDGVGTITAGATGLIALYSNIFSWLPSEVTVILTSGLLLMIGLRVFRK